ncbi:hypothetical protein FLJC2902T_31920 [Flavobacterium limnosediminis JC2902]|uniref:Cthe-2314-like HEPN domain-containing protein n=1 Tax=Flavobacterium limnosediminis JC2902 TaxID=1341181 RepID=V6SJW6_9FLAO|nr:hypothetical protein [Flavobacterium limnosediminis]ESU24660.1 hypothetical protein FLJC2902T_31920 [Flavobacterium limnosediminis JC2902]
MKIKDVENPVEEFRKLSKRFSLLNDRFLAVAMDYKYYIDSTITDNEIFKLRDNVIYKLQSAKFHFQLLLEYHDRIEYQLDKIYKTNPKTIIQNEIEFAILQQRAIREIYSIFDSMIYHLCSIFDYLFRLINFAHNKEIAESPKWNLFQTNRNLKGYMFCSKEMVEKLKIFDQSFVYPLIKHRSYLIHTENDTGEFTLSIDLKDKKFDAKFLSTELFKNHFPEIVKENKNADMTIKYSALWLIDKTIINATEILFELSEDMQRNKKIEFGLFIRIGENNTIESPSTPYWGNRKIN